MDCISLSKIEAWLTGEDPQALNREAWTHLRTCPTCNQAVRMAMAMKDAALPLLPSDSDQPSCSRRFDDATLLRFLDDMMEEAERLDFEGHLNACAACKEALLYLESEIANSEIDQVEVPGSVLAKAKKIGEAEAARQRDESWAARLGKLFVPGRSAWLQPRWLGAAAIVAILILSLVFFFRLRHETGPMEPTNLANRAVPTPPSTQVDPAVIARAQRVLDRIERVADDTTKNPIRLQVVNSDQYIAQISPQGELSLSTQYMATAKSDDELAFLIAHEVVHREHPAACVLSFSTSAQPSPSSLNVAQEKRMELQADRLGVFYASVAGYHADAAESLLSRIQSIPNISDAAHPAFKSRLQETAAELNSIVQSIELFRVGVSFFDTEQYSRSVAVFQKVAQMFPSREAINDYGLAYHKLALEYSSQNWGFKKSVILDPVARAIEPIREDLPQANLFSAFMQKALAEYRKAIARDPGYVAVRINLASALDDQGDYAAANRELHRVLAMNPTSQARARAFNNLGVIAAEQSQWTLAQALFTRAAKADAGFSDPHFNLARVLEMRHEDKAATAEYARYAQLAANERDGWLRMAFNKLNRPWPQTNTDALEDLPKLGQIQLGDTVDSVVKRLGPPTVTWRLETPTQLHFFVSLFEKGGLVISGSEDMIDFAQTTPAFQGVDAANHLSPDMGEDQLTSLLRRATRAEQPGSRQSYIDFDRGLGINVQDSRVDTWYIFVPIA